jgi:DNA-binding MarR family transcriptional regulator
VYDEDFERFRNQLRALHRRMRREQPAVEGITSAALEVLIALDGSDEPMRPGQLGFDLQMTSSNVAAALRSLESLGLVGRTPDPTDGRKALLAVTRDGRAVVADSRKQWRAWLQGTIERSLTETERRVLFEAGNLMQRLAEDRGEGAATLRVRAGRGRE